MQQTYSSKSLDTTTPLEILIDEHTLRGASYIASVLSKEKRATVEGKDTKIDNIIRSMIPLDYDYSIILKYPLAFVFDGDDKEMKIYRP